MEETITPRSEAWAHYKSVNRGGFKEEGSSTNLSDSCPSHQSLIHSIAFKSV